MKDHLIPFLSLLMTAVLLFTSFPAFALTDEECEDLYQEAVSDLEAYLEGGTENEEWLREIYDSFGKLSGYEKSDGYASYVHVLLLLLMEEYDSVDLAYEIRGNLKTDTQLLSYLENDKAGSPVGTVTVLENYVNGRKAESIHDESAISYFAACGTFFDAQSRYDALVRGYYENAYALLMSKEYAAAYEEYKLCRGYGDSEKRMSFIEGELGYSPDHEHDWLSADCYTPRTCSICGMTDGGPLQHDWDEGTVTTGPTCVTDGEMVRTCRLCRDTVTESIPATGIHDWSEEGVETVPATCGSNGTMTYRCKNCTATREEVILATGDHDWDDGRVTVSATCLEPGERQYKCKNCNEKKTEYIPAIGAHDWDAGKVTKKATCSSFGVVLYTCKACGQTKSENTAKDYNNHTGGTEVRNKKDATCGADGYSGDTYCKSCGAMIKNGSTIAATGKHDWKKGEKTKEATCIASGTMTYICKTCGQTRSESIAKDKNNHAGETEIRNMKDATCGANGYTGDIYCKSCGAMIKSGRTVAATGKHNWIEATYSTPKTCIVCGKTEGDPKVYISGDPKRVGGYITFGNYYQNNDSEKEPIEWLVLDYDSKTNRALVISRYGLDSKPYNTENRDVTWETCTLRTWLNGEFLNAAFSAAEQNVIPTVWVDNSESQCYSGWNTSGGKNTQDRIFLLSYAEANKYFNVQHNSVSGANNNTKARTTPTMYAINRGASQNISNKTADGEYSGWWCLRSPGYFKDHVAHVRTDGSLNNYYVRTGDGSVRPALWLDLSGI